MNRSHLRVLLLGMLVAVSYQTTLAQASARRLPAAAFEKSLPAYIPLALDLPATNAGEEEFREFTLSIDGWEDLTFQLFRNRYRSDDYRLHTASGQLPDARREVYSYSGYLSGTDYQAFLTLDEDYVYGYFEYEGQTWYIQPMERLMGGVPGNYHVLSQESAGSAIAGYCGTHTEDPVLQQTTAVVESTPIACRTVEIALAADYSMYAQFDDVFEVERHMLSVLNMVQSNYLEDFTLALSFLVKELYVVDEAAGDPWTSDTDAETFLTDFTNWGNQGGFSTRYDIASLWTDRVFNDSVVGLAWVREVCSIYRYNVLSDFFNDAQKLRVLQAQEIGHNFGASHDKPESLTIMAPRVNTSITWSNLSTLAINYNLPLAQRCMEACVEQIAPTAGFSMQLVDTCNLYTVAFADTSINDAISRKWIFEGGSPEVSFLAQPEVSYDSAGIYDVQLIVQNMMGMDTLLMQNLIRVPEKTKAPEIRAVVDTTSREVQFLAVGTNLDSLRWDFGDGRESVLNDPLHVYDTSGWYEVRLTAKNSCRTDTSSLDLMLIAAPKANFTTENTTGCIPAEIRFRNTSEAFAGQYSWEFPGGFPEFSEEEQPVVTYTEAGTYPVRLQVFNDAGTSILSRDSFITVAAAPDSGFTYSLALPVVSFLADPAPGDRWLWDFGDGATDSLQVAPAHRYDAPGTYMVKFLVSKICSTTESIQTLTLEGVAPDAGIRTAQDTLCGSGTISFTDNSTGDPHTWFWLFPGGSPDTSTLSNPMITYTQPGVYDVALGISNNWGSDYLLAKNRIHVLSNPLASLKADPSGKNVAFFSTSTGGSLRYFWDFGDGKTSNLETPFHIYESEGNYRVQLVAQNYCGSDTTVFELALQFTDLNILSDSEKTRLFPNPSDGNFDLLLDLEALRGRVRIDLFDATGRHIRESWIDNSQPGLVHQLKYQNLLPGVYILQCSLGAKMLTKKLLVH